MSFRIGKGQFTQKWVFSPREDSINPEIDPYRTVYPWISALTGAGLVRLTSQGRFDSFVSVPSTKHYLLRGIVYNNRGGDNLVVFYDGASASAGLLTLFELPFNPSAGGFVDLKDGVIIESALYASNLDSGLLLRAVGMMIESGVI